jgi:hypothetical protein|tara:strand:+ start:865 stop:1089 length:225 start_codon:yes stop_codon:yes gene_type:complete
MSNQEGAGAMKWLCFLFPLLGLILYIMWKDEKPVAASECGKFAIYGVIFGIVLSVIWTILSVVAFSSAMSQIPY